MKILLLTTLTVLSLALPSARANEPRPNLSGTWKLQPAGSDAGHATDETTMLVIQENAGSIHIRETRRSNSKDDTSDFTCATMGQECPMKDGGEKASVSVYYNGPVLVVLKTHGRKGDSVEKRRMELAPSGNSLTLEVIHLEPQEKTEKLVFAKVN